MSEEGAAEAYDADAGSLEAEATGTEETQDYEASAEDKGYDLDSWDSALEKELSIRKLASGDSANYNESDEKAEYGGKKESRSKSAGSSKVKDISDKIKAKSSANKSIDNTLNEILDSEPDELVEEYLEKQNYWFREAWYVMKGFLQNSDRDEDSDIYKVIDKKAKNGEPLTFLLPGLFQFPYNSKNFEEYSGLSTVHIGTRDPDEIHNILGYAMDKAGVGSILIGFSDGEKRGHKYFKKHGDSKISMFYGVDSDKGKVENVIDPERVIYIDGAGNLARAFESVFGGNYMNKTNRPVIKIPGAAHAGLVHNPRNIAEIGKIIGDTAKAKYFNYEIKYAA